jgi:hypothetical protein
MPDSGPGTDFSDLVRRSKAVGEAVGWDLELVVWPSSDWATLNARTTGTDYMPVFGPVATDAVARAELTELLDDLLRGTRTLQVDRQGDPTLR